jgi:hypothetical protein
MKQATIKMTPKLLYIFLFFAAWGPVSVLKAENPADSAVTGVSSGSAAATVSPDSDNADSVDNQAVSGKSDDDPEDEALEPFKPNWTGDLSYTFSTQPSPLGQGQVTQEIALTGQYNFTEAGDNISLATGGGQQYLEGLPTSYGTFTAGGGLVFGFFQPALLLTFQQGAQALNSIDADLTMTLQFWKPLSLGFLVEANPQSHQAALSTILGGSSDKIDEIDNIDLTGGAVITFNPWDFLELSLTGEQDDSTLYEWQSILHANQHLMNQTTQIPSATLASTWTLFTDFSLMLSLQEGVEYIPAGISYNAISKKTLNLAKATTDSFSGYSFELSYNL